MSPLHQPVLLVPVLPRSPGGTRGARRRLGACGGADAAVHRPLAVGALPSGVCVPCCSPGGTAAAPALPNARCPAAAAARGLAAAPSRAGQRQVCLHAAAACGALGRGMPRSCGHLLCACQHAAGAARLGAACSGSGAGGQGSMAQSAGGGITWAGGRTPEGAGEQSRVVKREAGSGCSGRKPPKLPRGSASAEQSTAGAASGQACTEEQELAQQPDEGATDGVHQACPPAAPPCMRVAASGRLNSRRQLAASNIGGSRQATLCSRQQQRQCWLSLKLRQRRCEHRWRR